MPIGDYIPNSGTFNLDSQWYKPTPGSVTHPSAEVVVDNLDRPYNGLYCLGSTHLYCACVRDAELLSAAKRLTHEPTPTPAEGGVSVESSARNDTKELGLENSLPQTSLRNPDTDDAPTFAGVMMAPTTHDALAASFSRRRKIGPDPDKNGLPIPGEWTPDVDIASLRYFTEDGTRYWTLHTELERLDRHQLVALAEMVRAE